MMSMEAHFQGKEVLEYFINELIKSGVTFIAPYSGETKSEANSAVDVSRSVDEGDKEQDKSGSEIERQRRMSSHGRFSLAKKSSVGLLSRKSGAARNSIDDCKFLRIGSHLKNLSIFTESVFINFFTFLEEYARFDSSE